MKTLLTTIILAMIIACDKEPAPVIQHTEVFPLCDTGSDCFYGVYVMHQASEGYTFYLDVKLPEGSMVCSTDYRTGENFDGYTNPQKVKNEGNHYYSETWIGADTVLTIWFSFTEAPKKDGKRYFGVWRAATDIQDQYEVHTVYENCQY